MLSKKMILLEQSFYKRALVLCVCFIGLLLLELFLFSITRISHLFILNGPLFYILAEDLRNKFSIKVCLVHLGLATLFLLSLSFSISSNIYYTVLVPSLSLLGYGIIFLTFSRFRYIVSDYKFLLKHIAWFLILLGLSALLFLINQLKLQDIKINTYFFIIGLTLFSVVYIVLLYRALTRNNRDNQYLNHVSLLREEYKGKVQALYFYFDTNKSFLDPDFNIDDLAESLGMDKKDVSFLLNHVLETNFYTLLAEKRIEVAQSLIENYAEVYTIEYIMLEAGFRSKSSFNRYFKLYTGKTPSEFRDTILINKR